MAKKCVVGLVGVVLLGTFLFGTSFFGYLGQVKDEIQQTAQDAVPFKMKLAEAKKVVANLDKVIAEQERQMAITMAERDGHQKNIKTESENMEKLNEQLVYLHGVLNGNDEEYVSIKTTDGTQKRSATEVKNNLKTTLVRFQATQKKLTTETENRDRQQKMYEEYQKSYDALVAKKERLTQRIKELEANQVALETRKATESVQIDDSAIKEAEDFLNKLEKDQAVQNNLLNIKKNNGGFEVDPNAEEEGDLLEEVKKAIESNAKPSKMISVES